MNALQQCLKHIADRSMGAVVHVHPTGNEVLEWALEHNAGPVVLATGQADTLALLRGAASSRPEVEVVEAVLSGASSAGAWSRFNVREVSGVLEPAGLRQVYPRLQLLEQVPIETMDLPTLLSGARAVARGGKPNLLVIEAPGLEEAILQAVPVQTLQAFDWVLVKAAREGLYLQACPPGAAQAHLQQHFYRLEMQDIHTDPLWPVSLFRFDEGAASRHALSNQVRTLEQQLAEVKQRSSAELAAMTEQRDAQAKLAQERLKQVEELGKASETATRLAADRLSNAEQLTKARDEQAKLVQQHAATLGDLGKARDELTKRLAEKDSQVQALTQAKAQAEKLAQERQSTLEQVTKARDEQIKLANERYKRIGQLDAEVNDISARYSLVQEELIKAEAHVELIGDLLFREPVR